MKLPIDVKKVIVNLQDKAKTLLRDHNMRLTHCRQETLMLFLQKPYALTNAFFEENLRGNHDRITIYRTLRSFLKSGILHKVLDDNGGIKYALCKENCLPEHNHQHVHFKCEVCNKTVCLEEVKIPELHLPQGYNTDEVSMLVTGICDQCSW